MSVSHESIAKSSLTTISETQSGFRGLSTPSYPVPAHDALALLDFVIEESTKAKWEAWANAVTESELARQVPFKSRLVGNAGLPAWQIVMHVVNHASLHRGQIVGMLRQLGMKPPATDILFYYYGQPAPVAS